MTTYAIIFKGELRNGFVRDAVMAAFRERANLTNRQVEQVFSGAKVTLKKGLSRDEAKRFARDMRALGMHVLATTPPSKAPAPEEDGYRILFDGQVVDGFSREAVMLTASARLKFTDAQRDLLFSGQEVAMKRGLSEDKARHYLDTLRKLGMNARVEPPLPAPAPDPMLEAAEASLIETQLAQQPAYNFEETFHSSSTLEMAQEAMAAAGLPDDIHPSLRTAPSAPTEPVAAVASPDDPSAQVATVINDDIVQAYADELAEATPDPAVEALRAAHDPIPATPAPPSSPPPAAPSVAAVAEPVAAVAEDMPADAPEEADEVPAEAVATPTAAGGATRTLAVVLGVVVVAALIAWWLA